MSYEGNAAFILTICRKHVSQFERFRWLKIKGYRGISIV